jgi:Fe-S cluster biogenesis protein NfuA
MVISDKAELLTQIDAALDEIRPHLAADGGYVEVVDITADQVVQVRWLGNCQNCTMSFMTMKAGIEHAIKGRLPQITGVEAVNGIG